MTKTIDLTLDDDRVLAVPVPDWCPPAYAETILGYAEPSLSWPWVVDEDDRPAEPAVEDVLRVCRQFLEAEPVELSRAEATNLGSLINDYWDDYYCCQSIEGDFKALGRAVADRLLAHEGGSFMATLSDCLEVADRLGHFDDGESFDYTVRAVSGYDLLDRDGAEVPADHPVLVAATRLRSETLPRFLAAAERLGHPELFEPDAPPPPDARSASPGCILR